MKHLGFLDGIRGIAAFWVLVAHCMIWAGLKTIPIPSPKIAVDIFMVASGFLMAYQFRSRSHKEPMDSPRTAVRFWMRRFFRIAPVYYLVLISIWIFWQPLSHSISFIQHANPERWAANPVYLPANHNVGWLNTLIHATFLFGLFPKYSYSNLSPDWSIGLEMQFYAVFPFLFLIFRRTSWFLITVASLAISIACNRWFAHLPGPFPGTHGLFPEPSFLLMKLPLFVIGMLAAEVMDRLKINDRRSAGLISTTTLLVSLKFSVIVTLCAAIILWIIWNPSKSQTTKTLNFFLSNQITEFMARTSYSVYLLHGFFIASAGCTLFNHPGFANLPPSARTSILLPIVSIASYLTAWIVLRAIEEPGINLGKKIVNHYITPTPPTPQSPAASPNIPASHTDASQDTTPEPNTHIPDRIHHTADIASDNDQTPDTSRKPESSPSTPSASLDSPH